MKLRFAYSAAILLPLAVGCGNKSGPQPDPVSLVPAVDVSLSKEAQARQAVVRNVLKNLQEGYPVERLKTFVPGLKFNETQAQFLDGAKYLESWSFNGQPTGNEVPVALVFTSEVAGGGCPTKVDRVYVVKGSPGRYTVSRK